MIYKLISLLVALVLLTGCVTLSEAERRDQIKRAEKASGGNFIP